MKPAFPRQLQLLAPARNASTAIQAILHGADAVYMGPSSHGARAAASNPIDDFRRVADFAHQYGAKLYATVNTIVYDAELRDVEKLVTELYNAGTDALIVQDMALLRLDIPPIALHASTQCDTRTPERARFLQDVGFSQIVLPRELSPDEIRAFSEAVDVPLEAFCHGALCVSYSGDCRAGFMATGRSANRGECPQMCRLPYDLIDGNGNRVVKQKHLLSLRDLNRITLLGEMADAGVSSFKIEGRLKDEAYVKNTVAAYSQALDDIVTSSGGRYTRSSYGQSEVSFVPDVNRSFNRGFTTYLFPAAQPTKMACIDTPKMTGSRIGTVSRIGNNHIVIKTDRNVVTANGDGLGYFRSDGTYDGFRINRADGNRIYPATMPAGLKTGMTIYRNSDKAWNDTLARDTARRTIGLSMTLRVPDTQTIALDLTDDRGCSASSSIALDQPLQPARSQQDEQRTRVLDKLGDTPYRLESLDDTIDPGLFIPASTLTSLRRQAIKALDTSWRSRRPTERRRPAKPDATFPDGSKISYRLNVANRLAENFYHEHGATEIARAVEVERPKNSVQVMECRYCIRRELGMCLRIPRGRELPEPLTLDTGRGIRYSLKFDCSRCTMSLHQTL
ncbi:MAG: U32 family peptidase [Muribaculaceae bacterium]|nr:U32 family peptidase [Muribaculaceae bacterium]